MGSASLLCAQETYANDIKLQWSCDCKLWLYKHHINLWYIGGKMKSKVVFQKNWKNPKEKKMKLKNKMAEKRVV